MAMSNENTPIDTQNVGRDPRLARLYEAAGADVPGPAPELDSAILAAARRAVNAGPRAAGGGDVAPVVRQKRNWYVPVSIAAVLVLSVSVVTLVHEEKGDDLLMPAPRPASAPAKARSADAAPTVQTAPAPELEQRNADRAAGSGAPTGAATEPAAQSTAAQREPDVRTARKVLEQASAVASVPAPAPKPGAAPTTEVDSGALARPQPATPVSPAPPAPPRPSADVTTRSPSVTLEPRGFDAGGFRQDGTPSPRASDDLARERRAAPTPFPALRDTVPAETPGRGQSRSTEEARPGAMLGGARQESRTESRAESVAKQAPADARLEDRVTSEARGPARAPASAPPPSAVVEGRVQSAPAAVAAAKPAPPMLRAAPKPSTPAIAPTRPAWLVELDPLPAERWLEKLVEFRRDGRTAEADELLAEFRKRFPEHPMSMR